LTGDRITTPANCFDPGENRTVQAENPIFNHHGFARFL
jgi:hypothetical protein